MQVSFKWLQEYTKVPVSPEELAERMTFSGVAVENINYLGEGIEKVVTARIEKLMPHPDADKLVVCLMNHGEGESLQIVTGAPNVAQGQIVILALVGAVLPGGFKIKKSKLRGVESSGMVCSAQELGLDPKNFPEDQREGIIILPPNTPLGMDVKKVLGLDDEVLELELTPNRADCLSMVGVAREVAAVLDTDYQMPAIEVPETDEEIEGQVKVIIEDPDLCGRYIGRLIRNVQIGPSPDWMQQRLQAAGVRPINNIVDITNYVMMEMGQPLHAFDYDKIKEQTIVVRRARAGEKIVTLDDEDRALHPDMLVIADAVEPVAVAGVMGGLHSEVTENTVNILLESAYFNGPSIRRTSKALGLRSEASLRFEKGIDPNGCLAAIDRAAQLMAELGAGQVVKGVVDNYPSVIGMKEITLRPARVSAIVGTEIPTADIEKILTRLQLPVRQDGNILTVSVPTFRGDITREIDLVEEVIRLYGYERIPTRLPQGESTQGKKTFTQSVVDKVKNILIGCGLYEVINMSFYNPKAFDAVNLPEGHELRNAVVVKNPISEEQGVLRTTLVPVLADVLSKNLARKNKDLAIFEIGRVFQPVAGEELPCEKLTLGAAITGQLPTGWNQQAEAVDFYYLKGIVETLFRDLHVTNISFSPKTDHPAFHPGRTASIMLGDWEIGIMGEAHPVLAENYRIPGRAYLMEMNLQALIDAVVEEKRYRELLRYPAVDRDMALVVKEEVPAAELLKIIWEKGGQLLKDVKLFDVYTGAQINQGYKSLAYSLLFQANDRTLTDDEVNEIYNRIQKTLSEKVGAELRA